MTNIWFAYILQNEILKQREKKLMFVRTENIVELCSFICCYCCILGSAGFLSNFSILLILKLVSHLEHAVEGIRLATSSGIRWEDPTLTPLAFYTKYPEVEDTWNQDRKALRESKVHQRNHKSLLWVDGSMGGHSLVFARFWETDPLLHRFFY